MKRIINLIKYFIKNIFAYILFYSGILHLLKKYKFNNKTIVLMYHRILPKELINTSFSNDAIIVQPNTFSRQLEYLNRYFDVININQFNSNLVNNNFNKNTQCLITFDDGWVDNYIYALPVIKKHDLPATIFLPADYIDTHELFWQEKLARAIFNLSNTKTEEARTLLSKLQLKSIGVVKDNHEKRQIIINYVSKLKSESYTQVNQIYNKIISVDSLDNSPNDIDLYLNLQQIDDMKKHNISFGSHACSHKILTRLSKEEIRKELVESRDKLNTINKDTDTPLAIAYPNGNSNLEVHNIAKDVGYVMGFGTNPGHVTVNDNQFDIKRINIHETKARNKPMFMMILLGIY
ncbi:MAG: polysaccharide deacetylase family protein [Gammaproteobacteria bacterium]|nr:polysaccharide deacetylase family protein [Gammaproteobacteria bacterium]